MISQSASVVVENVWKSYGKKNAMDSVLQGTDMCVPTGSIYGLLGPSGCGKTTLLRCLVGSLTTDSGSILAFGCSPRTSNSGIPGPTVGYMPQELALQQEMTIQETFNYFGRLHSMSAESIKERTEFLLQLLSLPDGSLLVKNLSGGQQRRVSFAVALLHEPPLLILDEPTVGVDPILRQRIWQHLSDISSYGSTTVIITTHYIEEARHADRVGLMRKGRVLAEGTPNELMNDYNSSSLEDVFLKLCRDGGINISNVPSNSYMYKNAISDGEFHITKLQADRSLNVNGVPHVTYYSPARPCHPRKKGFILTSASSDKVRAMVIKNYIKMYRTFGFMLSQFGTPLIQIALFCLAIGREPRHLHLAIYNNDSGHGGMSYLHEVSNSSVVQVPVSNFEDGLSMVRHGQAWGVVTIGNNFSDNLMTRLLNPQEAGTDRIIMNGSAVHINMDMIDGQIGYSLMMALVNGFQSFAKNLLKENDLSPALATSPVVFEEPIYGTNNTTFTEFVAPGIIISICYLMAVALMALSIVMDRKEGIMERSYVCGVTTGEQMLSHIITQFGVMAIQVTLVLIFVLLIFQLPCQGNVIWVFLLTLLQGTCGMTFGLFLSTILDHENTVIMVALATVYPTIILSGILWPVEAMPYSIRFISNFLPQAHATEALRCILSRGKDLSYLPVWRGYLVTSVWIAVFFIASSIVMRVRQ